MPFRDTTGAWHGSAQPGHLVGRGARVRVGSVELDAIVDAWGELGELGELYPEVPAGAWEPYRTLYPDLFAESRWRVPCTSYLIRAGGVTVLVDTGVGPAGLW